LVIDCNRTPGSGTSILDLSELTRVPGNIGLSERHKLARERAIFQPYHDRIATELDRRREGARPTALISVHFTWTEQDVGGGKLVVEVTVKNAKARPKTDDQLRSDARALAVRFARAFADTIENQPVDD
jgi:N-formylglutamate amidohydrolase